MSGVLAKVCCDKQAINTMQDGAIHNAVCTNCYSHWYGRPGNVRQFSRSEWDSYLSQGGDPEPREPIPVLSMIDGFAVHLRSIGADPSAESMLSIRHAVSNLLDAAETISEARDHAFSIDWDCLRSVVSHCKGPEA